MENNDYPVPDNCSPTKPGCSPVAFEIKFTHPNDWPSAAYTVCENHTGDVLVMIYRPGYVGIGASVRPL